MKRLTLGIVATAALALPAHWANAQLSYSYVRAAVIGSEIDIPSGGEDALGGELELSYDLLDFLHAFGGFSVIELNDLPLESEQAEIGVGFNLDLSPQQSVFFDLSLLSIDSELQTGLAALNDSEEGYGASIGYRETNHTRLEFRVSADYIKFDEVDYSDTSIDLSMQYEVTPRFKVDGGINFGGDDSYLKIGVRYYLPGPFAP